MKFLDPYMKNEEIRSKNRIKVKVKTDTFSKKFMEKFNFKVMELNPMYF